MARKIDGRTLHTCIHVIVIFQCHVLGDEGRQWGVLPKKLSKSFHALAKLNGKSGGEQRVTFQSRKMPAKEESLRGKNQKIYKMLDFNKCFN